MNANVEFDEIRPYHDEELPQVYEELICRCGVPAGSGYCDAWCTF